MAIFLIVYSQDGNVFKNLFLYLSTAINALLCYPHSIKHFLRPFHVYVLAIFQILSGQNGLFVVKKAGRGREVAGGRN